MFISLLILVAVLCLIFGHSYVGSLMDNVRENRSLLSPLDITHFQRNAGLFLRFEGGNTLNTEEGSNYSITNPILDVEFPSDNWQHQPSVTSNDEGTNVEEPVYDKQNPSVIGNDRRRTNFDSNLQNLARRENLEQLGLELKSAFWGPQAVRTDTVGTDNKYKGTKEHLLQALKDSIHQENSTVASRTLAPTALQTGNVYSVTLKEPPRKLNLIQSHGNVNEESEKEIRYKNSPSASSDRVSMYAECNSSSSNVTNNNNVVEKILVTTIVDERNKNGEDLKKNDPVKI